MLRGKIRRLSICLICLFLGACSLNVTKGSYQGGSILVMPPHDVVQAGRPHPVGAGSGRFLQNAIVKKFAHAPRFSAVAYEADASFGYLQEIDVQKALRAASNRNLDFVLIAKLGEFRDAAPATFRSDFVTLQEARLVEVKTGKEAWALREPFSASGTNIGSYYPLLEELAEKVASSIIR